MKTVTLDLEYLAKTYGIDVLLLADVIFASDGRTMLEIQGSSKTEK